MCFGSQYFIDDVVAKVCIITNLIGHKIITVLVSILYYKWGIYFKKRIEDNTTFEKNVFNP